MRILNWVFKRGALAANKDYPYRELLGAAAQRSAGVLPSLACLGASPSCSTHPTPGPPCSGHQQLLQDGRGGAAL